MFVSLKMNAIKNDMKLMLAKLYECCNVLRWFFSCFFLAIYSIPSWFVVAHDKSQIQSRDTASLNYYEYTIFRVLEIRTGYECCTCCTQRTAQVKHSNSIIILNVFALDDLMQRILYTIKYQAMSIFHFQLFATNKMNLFKHTQWVDEWICVCVYMEFKILISMFTIDVIFK